MRQFLWICEKKKKICGYARSGYKLVSRIKKNKGTEIIEKLVGKVEKVEKYIWTDRTYII